MSNDAQEKEAIRKIMAQQSTFRGEKQRIIASLGGSPADLVTPSADASLQRKLTTTSDFPTRCDTVPLQLDSGEEQRQYRAEEQQQASSGTRCGFDRRIWIIGAILGSVALVGVTIVAIIQLIGRTSASPSSNSNMCVLDRSALRQCNPEEGLNIPDCARIMYHEISATFLPTGNITACGAEQMAAATLAVSASVHNIDDKGLFFALATIYFSLGGETWQVDQNWLEGPSACAWYGVDCADDAISVDLRSNNLLGSIPTQIGFLTSVSAIDLRDNFLYEDIPSEIGLLTKLKELHLSRNSNLGGQLPSELFRCTQLASLLLTHTDFSGSLPTEIGNVLGLEQFSFSALTLTKDLPSELGNLVALRFFSLSSMFNSNYHVVPLEVASLPNLERLFLNGVSLDSSWLSVAFAAMTKLISFDLDSSKLSTSLPTNIGLLRNLETLAFGLNDLTGTLPTELGQILSLKDILFYQNSLTGTIPTEMGFLTRLSKLIFEINELSGNVPSEIGQLSNLDGLSFIGNSLTGTIPSEVCALNILTDNVIAIRDNLDYSNCKKDA